MKTLWNKINLALIFALMFVLLANVIAPERAAAQGVNGSVTYTVLPGQTMPVFGSPDANSNPLGGITEGTYTAKGNQLAGGWYKIQGSGGADWYFFADPNVVTVSFAASGGTTQQTSTGLSTSGTTWGPLSTMPGARVMLVIVTIIGFVLAIAFLSVTESLRDGRTGLIGWMIAGWVIEGILIAALAFINTKSEACYLNGVVCFANGGWGYALSALVTVFPVWVLLSMWENSKPGPKHKKDITNPENTMEIFDAEPQFSKRVRQAQDMGYTYHGSIQTCVGAEIGKYRVSMVMEEDGEHREGAPIALFVMVPLILMPLFGVFGLAYLGPIHFRVMSMYAVGQPFTVANLPFLAIAFVPLIFFIIEMLMENHHRPFILAWWAATWLGAWISPWPPILTFGVMHLIAIFSDDKGKNFWKGHSDLVILTLYLGIAMLFLGFPWFFSFFGGLWLDTTSWGYSWASIGGAWLKGIVP